MSGVLKLGNVTLGTENSGKVDLTNVGAASANTVSATTVSATTVSATTVSTSSFTSDIQLFRVGLNNDYSLTRDSTVTFPADKVIYDTHSRFNATSSASNGIPAYSFMPTVSGYYNFIANIMGNFQSETVGFMVHIQKYTIPVTNSYESVSHTVVAPTGSTSYGQTSGLASGLIYMNGTSDYVLCKIYQYNYTNATSENIRKEFSFFQGFLVRK